MKKRNQLYSALAAITIGLSVHAMGQAQSSTTFPQSEEFDAPVSLTPAATRAASWQGQEIALRGTDVVSYFQADAPIEGSQQYAAKWNDTTWHFSSEENLDLFAQNPHKYVPQFGGYCPVALSRNHAKVGLSKQFTVVDDKLYLNYNEQAREEFRETPKEYIVRAQLNF